MYMRRGSLTGGARGHESLVTHARRAFSGGGWFLCFLVRDIKEEKRRDSEEGFVASSECNNC